MADAASDRDRQNVADGLPAKVRLANNPATTDASPSSDARDAAAAYRDLARLWNVTLDDAEPCSAAPVHDLHCYTSTGGFAELRQVDRPAVLTLRDDGGQPYYGVLIDLGNTTANVRIGGKIQTVSVVSLARQFTGQFTTFWRAPERFRGRIEYGARSAEVDWLATQLAKLDGNDAPPPQQPFDQQMATQVRDFQYAQGLKVDGLVGPRTMMQLNRAAGVDEPRLQRAVAIAKPGVK